MIIVKVGIIYIVKLTGLPFRAVCPSVSLIAPYYVGRRPPTSRIRLSQYKTLYKGDSNSSKSISYNENHVFHTTE